MNTYTYARRWNNVLHNEIDPISETEARNIFNAHEEFFIAVERDASTGAPVAILEIGGSSMVVNAYRLDKLERIDVSYHFQSIEGADRLFLSHAASYGYGGDQYAMRSQSDITYSYYFRPDSDIVIIDEIREALEEVRHSEKDGYDLTMNWQSKPSFGEWKNLLNFERKQ